MSKKTLSISEDYDFGLIGISSHAKDYRLCWELNQLMKLNLVKKENISSRISEDPAFTHYIYDDDENHLHYHLIGNKSSEGYFTTEIKQADYFLLLQGDHAIDNATDCLPLINGAGTVLTAFEIDVLNLKTRDHFILE